jgi:threonine/homoserine/homoserine lactone efflux protein
MKLKDFSLTDKLFFGSMIPYLIIGIADVYYRWFDPTYITTIWILFLFIVVVIFIWIPQLRANYYRRIKKLSDLRDCD